MVAIFKHLERIKLVVFYNNLLCLYQKEIGRLDSQNEDGCSFFFQDGYWNFKETSQVQIATEGTEMTVLDSALVAGSRRLIDFPPCTKCSMKRYEKNKRVLYNPTIKMN